MTTRQEGTVPELLQDLVGYFSWGNWGGAVERYCHSQSYVRAPENRLEPELWCFVPEQGC